MKLPENIKKELLKIACHHELYWAGGPVRDILLSRPVTDIDIVLPQGAISIAGEFAAMVNGTLIVLDETNGVGRVVTKDCILDFSEFREGAADIEEDLWKRDITINAMAMSAASAINLYEMGNVDYSTVSREVIDPCNGMADMEKRVIRAVSGKNLRSDPLRLLRVYRFMAELGFVVASETLAHVKKLAPLILNAAAERVNEELTYIMDTPRSGFTFRAMASSSLLEAILPEINQLSGVEQPDFHHLDVLEHCFETLACMDSLVQEPWIKFPDAGPLRKWLQENEDLIPSLKWTAFMHDWGKPAQKGEKNGRVTFYNHDRTGAEMARSAGSRLRWKKGNTHFTALMVEMHMRPFHLLPAFRAGGPSRRALRRLLEKTGSHYPALFLQAMADSMAGCGPLKPQDLDEELAGLAARVHRFHEKRMVPARKAPRLLTGKDIMEIFGLEPGPVVGHLLRKVETARIEGMISDRDGAVKFTSDIIEK